MVVLVTRNSKAWPMIARRFRKSLPAASPPPSLATNSAVTGPGSSLVPSGGTAVPQVSRRSASKLSIGTYESWEHRLGGSCSARIVSRRCRPSWLRSPELWRCPRRVLAWRSQGRYAGRVKPWKVVVILFGERGWVVDVGRYIDKIGRGPLASSSLEALVSDARSMEIVASAA